MTRSSSVCRLSLAAVAAARAMVAHSSLSAAEIVRQALEIAAGIDVYTNTNITVLESQG